MEKYLGIDIGGTFIKYAVLDSKFNVLDNWKVSSCKFDNKDEFYDYLCENMKLDSNIKAIGVSSAGLIDEDSNVLTYASPNLHVMRNTNVNEEVYKRTNLKTRTINDAKAAGLCEFRIGNAKHSKTSVFLVIGTGIGGCICDQKGVLYGVDSFAGEFHSLVYYNIDTKEYKPMGDTASITGLVGIYNKQSSENVTYGTQVIEKYLKGDSLAIVSVSIWIKNIVAYLILIVSFYNPDKICIGGGVSEETWLIEGIRKEFEEYLVMRSWDKVITTEIDVCKYNNNSNIIGAVINTLEN